MSVYFPPNSSKFFSTMMANVIDNSTRQLSVKVVTHLLLQITTYTKANFNEKHKNFKDVTSKINNNIKTLDEN